ncbi:MAG: transglycosylase domain-containing protein, partial [Alistipes sp.]|nr:transglycosylase domain-containing protein [Alistipes sp.]
AVKLEHNYTKEEIIAMYLNTVEYGSNSYGIKSAANTFFGKTPDALNLQEAAVLVGVVNAPTRYSPVRNPENALNRRNLVLRRIHECGAISREELDSISALPIVLNFRPVSHNYGKATYFREMLRLVMNANPPKRNQFYTKWDYDQAVKQYEENPLYGWCHKNKKADGTPYNIYRDGLKIYTTIDASMQEYAEQALIKQLKTVIQPAMDEQVRTTQTLFNDTEEEEVEKIIRRAMRNSDRYRNMKNDGVGEKEIYESFERRCRMKVFTYHGERDTLLTPRDSILHHKRIMRASFVAIEPQTGHIKAYVGGPNFQYFKYDMAKQGKRQIGSTVKPFIYTFAIDHLGMSPCTMVPNLPVTIETAVGTAWSPKEAGKVEYDGVLHPLKWGLALSRNNYSAWIMKQAKQPEAVADFIHNMGISSFIDPVYALCLGTFESNIFEMVGAYATFANEGVHNKPIFVTHIEDRQGNLISSFSTSSQDAISRETAYTMVTMLKNVITNGTGRRMGWQFGMDGVDIAGKTGTSNNNRDGWFMCITPRLVAGAWVGGEDQSIHLRRRGEGSVMALPIVGDFLKHVHEDPACHISRDDKFIAPPMWEEQVCDEEQVSSSVQNDLNDEFFE